MDAPSTETVKKQFDNLTGIVEWATEIWYSRNWVKRLILIDIVLFLAFNPYYKTVLKFIETYFPLPKHYDLYFWLVIAAIFIAALVVGIRARAKKITPVIIGERTAIKGLLPFGFKDAEVFTRLQRDTELKECYEAIAASDFRFGILSGESGNGKSSFLQAGLWPALQRENKCVYIKFTDYDPLLAIRHAIIEQVTIPEDKRNEPSFLEFLKIAAAQNVGASGGKSLILMMDQFEQFFVHQKRRKDREPLIQALNEWFRYQPALPVRIFIGIRNDFVDRLTELQKVMGYSLGPQQNFRLEKFKPDQAARIFEVIAETEKLEYKSSFIEEMTTQELADKEDGLVSPVDIQVLAWIVAGQTNQAERAFNRSTFQKLGGVEGLLERFLQRALDARETPNKRQAAVKVLLSLIDLDRNTRAGVLTMESLRQKLNGALSDAELKETIEWLAQADVRLINAIKLANEDRYEISHERLIAAIRKLSNTIIEPAAKATLLLDRRANEWIGNNRSNRYLLNLPELLLLRKQKPFIQWEPNRSNKEAFITRSWKRFRTYSYVASLCVGLVFAGMLTWNTQWAQFQLIKWELSQLSNTIKVPGTLYEISESYAYQGDFAKAEQVVKEISDPYFKAKALSSIAEAAAKQGDFAKAEQVVKEISDPPSKAKALSSIAEAAAKQGDFRTARLIANLQASTYDQAQTLALILKTWAIVQNPRLAGEP